MADFGPPSLKLTSFGDGKTWLEPSWNGLLPTFRWNRGIFPGGIIFPFLKDWGSVKTWKLLTGIIGFNQGEFCSSPFKTDKGDEISNWSGLHRAGDDWDLLIFLVVFSIFSGFETPNCKGELGQFLVPTPLVATVKYWWKVAFKICWFNFTSYNQWNDKYPREK